MTYYELFSKAENVDELKGMMKKETTIASEHGIPFGGKADDVIKVCRCKDCKWFQSGIDIDGNPFTRCNGSDRTYGHTEPDWFCADGERRTYEQQTEGQARRT